MASFLIDVPMPAMGATVSELTIIDLKVKVGERIHKGQKIAELESDKSVFEYESPCDALVRGIPCRAGDIIASGALFLQLETDDASLRHLESKNGSPVPALNWGSGNPAADTTQAATATATQARPSGTSVNVGDTFPSAASPASAALQWTPRALKLLQEAGVDPSHVSGITGTGPGGRISGDDITRYLESRKTGAGPAVHPAPSEPSVGDQPTTVSIAGIGYAVPRTVMPNSEILKNFPNRTEEEMIKLTGIKERRHADDDETATDLAAAASEHALRQAGMQASELDGVILATLIPDQPVPSMASKLAKRLGVPHALAFDINAACSGWLYALEVGRSFIRSGTAKKLLVVTAELLSRITNPCDKETAFLFGDGAGAAVLTDCSNGHRLHPMALSGDANLFEAIQRPGGGALKPVPHPEGHDLAHFYLQMDGAAVFKAAVVAFANQIERTLERHQLKPEDVAWIVPHQANERILKAVSKRVGIPYEKFIVTISKYGNTSAASVSMALGWAAEEGVFNAGDRIIFCSVGAGLTFAGGLLVW